MGRKLKYHEQKLLKKTSLLHWKKENNLRVGEVMARFCLRSADEYHRYNRLVGEIQKLTNHLRQMDPDDEIRMDLTRRLVDRVYKLGIIGSPAFSECADVNVSSVCKRRFSAILVQLKFCEKISEADRYIRQGHFRIGPDVVTDPATLVSRANEDFIAHAHGSKIQEHVKRYNDEIDDFDMMQ